MRGALAKIVRCPHCDVRTTEDFADGCCYVCELRHVLCVAGDTKRLNCVQVLFVVQNFKNLDTVVFHRSKFHILIFEDCATSQTWGYENREKEQWRRGECSQFQQTRLFNTVAYCTYMKSHVATIRVNIFVHSLYFYF